MTTKRKAANSLPLSVPNSDPESAKNPANFTEMTTIDRYYRRPPSLKEAWGQEGLINKLMHLLQWWNGTRLGRTITRYGMQRGALMSGGIAYSALFSIGAGLTIAWTIFMYVLGDNKELQLQVIKNVNKALPGLLSVPGKEGLLDPSQLILDKPFTIASVIAIAMLLFASTYVMANLRISIRAMFGISYFPSNFLFEKLRDLLGFIILGAGVLVTTALGFLVTTLGNYLLNLLDMHSSFAATGLKLASLIVAALVDAAVWCMLVSFISGVKVPRKDLLIGGITFGVLAGVLRYLGTAAVSSVSDNPLLASVAALATLLLWVNLLSRVSQLVAAWTANPPTPALPNNAEQVHMDERPNYVTMSRPETLLWPHQKVTGTIDVDSEYDENEETEEKETKVPYYGGLIGAYQRWRINRLEAKLAEAKDKYYGKA